MQSTKPNQNTDGFTVVEILVTIIVIAILATIVSINYNTIQKKTKSSTAYTQAQEIEHKAEAYAATTGLTAFPTLTELSNATGTATLSHELRPMLSASAPTNATQTTVIQYIKCTGVTGAKIGYWDSSLPTPAVVYLLAGAATNATTATC